MSVNSDDIYIEKYTETLQILDEVKSSYENKLLQLDTFEDTQSVIELKCTIYRDWTQYLQEENKLLAQLIKDIEGEAIEQSKSFRSTLEELSKSTEAATEKKFLAQRNYLQKHYQETIKKYDTDLSNVLRFIKRIRETNQWNVNGLTFHYVTYKDLYGDPTRRPEDIEKNVDNLITTLKTEIINLQHKQEELEVELKKKQRIIKSQEQTLRQLREVVEDDNFNLSCLRKSDTVNSQSALQVWHCSKEVTNNIIKVWERVSKIKNDAKLNNGNGFVEKDEVSMDALQEAVNQIAEELKQNRDIEDDIRGDALLFFIFDKNKRKK